ncbi:MAG: 50S ribosomal protein L29 [Candidatus Omnitrophica bacterium]|nr:50S ribosomal protein L29 [Candidatus Omnitrophota bacterium]
MARLKPENVRNMTDAELEQTMEKLREDIYKVRVEAQTTRLEKPHRIREAKRNIARCLTIMRERKRGKD